MKDSEFWAVMAITVEMAETMPDTDFYMDCAGLCQMVNMALYKDVIDVSQHCRLKEQIKRVAPRSYGLYYWPAWEWKPRVAAMKKLAKIAAKMETE